MRTRILSLLMVVSFIISTTGFAQSPKQQKQRNMNPEQKVRMEKRFEGEKKLQEFFTEEQNEEIKKIRLETAKKVKPFRDELRELRAHEQTLTTAEQADLKAINKNIDKMSEVRAEIAKIMAAQHQQIRSLLTEEQRIRFDNRRGGVMRRPDRRI